MIFNTICKGITIKTFDESKNENTVSMRKNLIYYTDLVT
jgi:hypothetical protein